MTEELARMSDSDGSIDDDDEDEDATENDKKKKSDENTVKSQKLKKQAPKYPDYLVEDLKNQLKSIEQHNSQEIDQVYVKIYCYK